MNLFSVVIPTFNRAFSLVDTIEAVLAQRFSDFELIVVDDGSTDTTRAVVERYKNDARLTYYFQPNKGVSAARNAGAAIAKGAYLIFLDSDDTVSDTWLADYAQSIKQDQPDLLFCSMQVQIPGKQNSIINSRNPYGKKGGTGNYIPGSFCVKRNIFEKAGGYDEKIRYGENTELSFRLNEYPPVITFVDAANLIYRVSTDGGSKNWRNKLDSNLYILEKHRQKFEQEKKTKQLLLGVAGVAAVHCGKHRLAKVLFWKSYMANLYSIKHLMRLMLVQIPFMAVRVWGNK